jgi:hypothetical protein
MAQLGLSGPIRDFCPKFCGDCDINQALTAFGLQSDENCARLSGSGSCTYVDPEVAPVSACPAGCTYEDKSPTPAQRCASLVQEVKNNCAATCRKDYATAVDAQQACLALPEGECGSILVDYLCVPDSSGGFLDTFDTPESLAQWNTTDSTDQSYNWCAFSPIV